MTKLETITAEDLQNRTYEPTHFLVDELIPEGLHILAGAPKIGKSWLALWLCLCVSQGQPLWNFATTQGEALYLSLEDSFQRIQTRLFDLTEDAPPTLHFAIMADTLKHGLEQQIEQFLTEHPDTKLVVIDTLQRVRGTGSDSNLYANDYQAIGLLKKLADKRHIAIILIHHLRKLHDDDPMNMISGSTGLSGAADSTFVLQKHSRLANIASLHCTGRDIPDRTLKLEFGEEDHIWKLLEDSKPCGGASKISTLQIENLLSELLQKEPEISAPAKALLEKIDPAGIESWTPNSFSHQIRKSVDTLRKNGIFASFRKSNGERLICLKRVDGADLPTVEKKSTLSTLRVCRAPAPRREARVAAVCGFLPRQRVCVRRGRKAHVASTCGQRGKTQVRNPEKPRRGGKNPPVREEPASHLASRRRTGSLPNASNRAEAHTHFMRTEENMRKNKQFSIRISAQDLETIRQKAVQAHMSQSDYVTACCLGKRIVILDGLREVLRQQKAIGNNLNQLTVLANMGKVQFANLDSAAQEFSKINTALRELQEGGAGRSQSSIS